MSDLHCTSLKLNCFGDYGFDKSYILPYLVMFIGRLQKLRELKTTENSALRGISSFVG